MRVFISVAGPDRSRVEPVALALRGRGFKVFFDEQNLSGGEDYNARISYEIGRADLAIFFISSSSLEPRRYTMSELKMIKDRWPAPGGRVLPVMLEPMPFEKVPAYLSAVKISKPQGNLAATVTSDVVKMAKLIIIPAPSERNDLVKTGMVAVAFALLTAVVCAFVNGVVLTSAELRHTVSLDFLPLAYVTVRAGVFALLLILANLFMSEKSLVHHLALFAAAFVAIGVFYFIGRNGDALQPVIGSSIVFAVVLAAIDKAYRTPTAVIGFVVAGLAGGILRNTISGTESFIWEVAMVACSIIITSVDLQGRGNAVAK